MHNVDWKPAEMKMARFPGYVNSLPEFKAGKLETINAKSVS